MFSNIYNQLEMDYDIPVKRCALFYVLPAAIIECINWQPQFTTQNNPVIITVKKQYTVLMKKRSLSSFYFFAGMPILNTRMESLLTAASIIFSPFHKRISDIPFTSPSKTNPLIAGGTETKFLLLLPRRKQP